MTCIVGLEADGKVYMGGDSAGVAGWDMTVRADEKVFGNGPFLIGFTTSFRMGQLLRYKLDVAGRPAEGVTDFEFMCTTFVDACRTCMKDGGYAEVDKSRESGGLFLVGFRGRLYAVGSDFQVGRSVCGFDSVGCGASVAMGAMAATPQIEPVERIRNALRIAERFSAGVRAPFTVLAS